MNLSTTQLFYRTTADTHTHTHTHTLTLVYPHCSVEFNRADSVIILSLLVLTCQGWLKVNGHNK